MSTNSSVVQLGAVSSMSGPHSILEFGERQEKTNPPSENDTIAHPDGLIPMENNRKESARSLTPTNQPHASSDPNDCCVPQEDDELSSSEDVAAGSSKKEKRPPPLEVSYAFPMNYTEQYHICL